MASVNRVRPRSWWSRDTCAVCGLMQFVGSQRSSSWIFRSSVWYLRQPSFQNVLTRVSKFSRNCYECGCGCRRSYGSRAGAALRTAPAGLLHTADVQRADPLGFSSLEAFAAKVYRPKEAVEVTLTLPQGPALFDHRGQLARLFRLRSWDLLRRPGPGPDRTNWSRDVARMLALS